MMADVFICHVEEDEPLVTALARGLEAAGVTTWYFERDSDPGPSYVLQTGEAIDTCTAVIIIISSAALSHPSQMRSEIVQAYEGEKAFLPVLADVTLEEFQQRQREWRRMLASATAVRIPENGISSIMPRLLRGLRGLGIAAASATQPLVAAPREEQPRKEEPRSPAAREESERKAREEAEGTAEAEAVRMNAEHKADAEAERKAKAEAERWVRDGRQPETIRSRRGSVPTIVLTLAGVACAILGASALWEEDALFAIPTVGLAAAALIVLVVMQSNRISPPFLATVLVGLGLGQLAGASLTPDRSFSVNMLMLGGTLLTCAGLIALSNAMRAMPREQRPNDLTASILALVSSGLFLVGYQLPNPDTSTQAFYGSIFAEHSRDSQGLVYWLVFAILVGSGLISFSLSVRRRWVGAGLMLSAGTYICLWQIALIPYSGRGTPLVSEFILLVAGLVAVASAVRGSINLARNGGFDR
jgi:TIR domain